MFGKKGMAAVMDAMLFLIILGIAASAMFVYEQQGNDGPFAEKIHNDLFDTELKVSDVFDLNDSRIVPIKDLIAAHIISGGSDIESYVYSVLRKMVPISHGFVFKCEFKGISMTIGEYSGEMTSYYGSEHNVADDVLYSHLTIF